MSTRFAVAVHLLTALGLHRGKPVPSTAIAKSVNTAPAVIRQLLMRLRRAGLVSSDLGPGGGTYLAKDPESISLRDVWQATEDVELIPFHRNDPWEGCPVGRHILPVLEDVSERAESAMLGSLGGESIASIMQQIEAREA